MPIIRFIQAGGTIDKDYLATDENHGYNFVIGEAAWHAIQRRAGIPYAVSFTSACRKDSLDMDGYDREEIKGATLHTHEEKIVIMHGTDTIHVTAEYLSDIKGKTIVLTGAMTPERFRDSDADFNVGMAVGAVHCLPPGVYIALYGEVKPWDEFVPR
jgi:L-asparaginase